MNNSGTKYSAGDCFVGYQDDTLATIVFKVTSEIKETDDKEENEVLSYTHMYKTLP